MKCPMCEGTTSVVDSRPFDDYIYRRRECDACEFRFQTREMLYAQEEKPKVKKQKPKPITRPVKPEVAKRVKQRIVNTRRRIEDLTLPEVDDWSADEWRNL